MCRRGAWAEQAARVTFMMRIQSRTPGFLTVTVQRACSYFFLSKFYKAFRVWIKIPINVIGQAVFTNTTGKEGSCFEADKG